MVRRSQDFHQATVARSLWADPQRVEDASASGTHGLLTKQLRSMSCPTWSNPSPPGDAGALGYLA
eukprot:15481018-Alexandrium_andersonii.AAC.1